MGVPLQLILGILLVSALCSFAEERSLRQIREAPPPPPAPFQNVTEINNRDLNKIVKANPKTEFLDSKSKAVNNVNNFEEFPIKLGKSEEERQNTILSSQKNETEDEEKPKKEEEKKDNSVKLSKEKLREDNSRTIDNDASKFWSSDFHSQNNDFTLSPTPNVATTRTTETSLEGTRHPSFDSNAELTTPSTMLFDQKFKETVESVEQKLDDIDLDNEEHNSQEEVENNDETLAVEDLLNKKPDNSSLEFEKSKTVVNNETIDKNSIHKDLSIEQTKKINFENIYNETKIYNDKLNKHDSNTTNKTVKIDVNNFTTSAPPAVVTKKSSIEESVVERSTSHLLSNNIETEFNPTKDVTITNYSGSSTMTMEKITETQNTTSTPISQSSKTESLVTSTVASSTTVVTPSVIRTNISDQENIIPLQLGTEKNPKSSFEATTTVNIKNRQEEIKTVIKKVVPEVSNATTETVPSTSVSSETTAGTTITNNMLSDGTTTSLPEEGTTLIVENLTELLDTTTESSAITTTVTVEELTSEASFRTSKSLGNSIVTEQMLRTSEMIETSTKEIDMSTESTIKNELDSTTLNNGKIEDSSKIENKDNVIQKVRDVEDITTEEVITTSTAANEEITTLLSGVVEIVNDTTTTTNKLLVTSLTANIESTVHTTEEPTKANTSTEIANKTQQETQPSSTTELTTTTELTETTASKQTTLPPEILRSNINYSTSASPNEESKKISNLLPNLINATEDIYNSSTTTTVINEEISNVTTTDDSIATAPTEGGFTKDNEGGPNKGKIAAIAISCVGAVCLVVLAGLLYVMKKRQRRLNYGPRCRPVSLDDYSIDNLSVYNSVRRKGGARMSKRSFGNPAFEDPVAPTHPLNFPALAKFSTNFEDIKAEFEEVPQITARTSELPDGCDTKNRYANVIPLPETRVYLNYIDGYPNSDYINANYVTGPKNVKGYYIATQAPLQNTVDDFWRMVWEQQAKVILMLTHLVENGLEKCVDYLPESEVLECSRLFGDFQITLKKREVKEKYIISSLQLKNMVSNSWREVTHFWYLGWPEKGVPSEANSLIAFLIEARSYMKTFTIDKKESINGIQNGVSHNEHNPVIIHCSPGTGRTGVAIACDIAIREFETTRLVDIPKIVYRIRRDRANAIQTKEQYTFIYKVVSLYATKLTGGALDNL